MYKVFSFCVVILLALFAGCDSPTEQLTPQNNQTGTITSASLSKGDKENNNNHDGEDHDGEDHDGEGHDGEDHDGDNHHESDNDGDCGDGGNSGCSSSGVVTLWAGKTTNVGTVTVTQDQNNLYVEYKTTGTWKIKETHLDIATMKYSQRGAPGQYDYQSSNGNGVTSYKYTIPITWTAGTKLFFLAHAVVGKYSGSSCSSTETAYGGTVVVPKKGSWYGTFCYDIQIIQPSTYSISGFTFVDANSNGGLDGGETGLGGVVVSLSNGSTTTSDASGAYSFSGLSAGSYVVTAAAVTGYTQSSSTASVSIATSNGSANFGYVIIPPPIYSISGYTFLDGDNNGIMDGLDTGFGFMTVSLTDGVTTITTTSDVNGAYTFSGLNAGTYLVSFVGPLPFGYVVGIPALATQSVSVLTSDGIANFGIVYGIDIKNERINNK